MHGKKGGRGEGIEEGKMKTDERPNHKNYNYKTLRRKHRRETS